MPTRNGVTSLALIDWSLKIRLGCWVFKRLIGRAYPLVCYTIHIQTHMQMRGTKENLELVNFLRLFLRNSLKHVNNVRVMPEEVMNVVAGYSRKTLNFFV